MRNTRLLRRMAAILYDSLLIAALLFLATSAFFAVRGGEPVEPENLLHQIVLLLVIYVFFVGYWVGKGRTLGMQSWGLQLETAAGQRPTFLQASIRFFAAILSWLPVGLGFLWQLWDKDRLAWHDRLSGTRLMHYPRSDEKTDP